MNSRGNSATVVLPYFRRGSIQYCPQLYTHWGNIKMNRRIGFNSRSFPITCPVPFPFKLTRKEYLLCKHMTIEHLGFGRHFFYHIFRPLRWESIMCCLQIGNRNCYYFFKRILYVVISFENNWIRKLILIRLIWKSAYSSIYGDIHWNHYTLHNDSQKEGWEHFYRI